MVTIKYFIKAGRNILMARIRANKMMICDFSTGLFVDRNFDFSTGKFNKEDASNARKLREFESGVYDRLDGVIDRLGDTATKTDFVSALKVAKVKAVKPEGVTLLWIAKEYNRRLTTGSMANANTGKPLSSQTIRELARMSTRWIEWIKSGHDLDLKKYNVATIHELGHGAIQNKYDSLIEAFKLNMINKGLGDRSIFNEISKFKKMIKYFCKTEGIELGGLLDELKYKATSGEVCVLSVDQVRYIMDNFRGLQEGCRTKQSKEALEYVYIGLVLNARWGDMTLWNKDNLYVDEKGVNWIKYKPNKTKNSSGVTIDYPVPDLAMEVFENNIKKNGKLMPRVTAINMKIKAIFKKIPEFQNEIQVEKNGKFVKMMQWENMHIHQMRSSGVSEKLMHMPEALVKELTGHTHDSRAFARYVKVSASAKLEYMEKMYGGVTG